MTKKKYTHILEKEFPKLNYIHVEFSLSALVYRFRVFFSKMSFTSESDPDKLCLIPQKDHREIRNRKEMYKTISFP